MKFVWNSVLIVVIRLFIVLYAVLYGSTTQIIKLISCCYINMVVCLYAFVRVCTRMHQHASMFE